MKKKEGDQIIGRALPLELNKNVDHTYVESASGVKWGCWGRSSGGRVLTTAQGDLDVAICLASDSGQADIVYGLTGVCHQAANRIMYQSKQTVENANGYVASVFAYGVYGIGRWSRRDFCMGESGAKRSGFVPDQDEDFVTMGAENPTYEQSGLGSDVLMLFAKKGISLNKREQAEILAKQKELFTLRTQLWSNAKSADEFRVAFEDELFNCLSSIERLVGKERFRIVFDGSPHQVSRLIDPSELAKAFK